MKVKQKNDEDKGRPSAQAQPCDKATTLTSVPTYNEPSMTHNPESQDVKRASPERSKRNLVPSILPCNVVLLQKGPAVSARQLYNNSNGSKRQGYNSNRNDGLKGNGPPCSSCSAGTVCHHGRRTQNGTVLEMELPECMRKCNHNNLLQDTSQIPPVTTETLQELDLQWIQNNVNLRVDVHYDHDLHFMPVSGRRGEEKRFDARRYWDCLEIELRIHQHLSKADCQNCSSIPSPVIYFQPRLPRMFDELRKLLLILVPDRERDEVQQMLNVDFIMQQVHENVLDIIKLSRWLSDLLKTHCAPVRDEWAEEMAVKISDGAHYGDMTSLVAGLEKLFSFCEAMKLDVANHQIRTFRVPLIEDGISFQRDYFSTRIRSGKFDIRPSRDWFWSVKRQLEKDGQELPGFDVLISGLVGLCFSPNAEMPKSLKHDSTRLRQMQEELQDIVHLCICLEVFDKRVPRASGSDSRLDPMHALLKSRIMDLTDGEAGAEGSAIDLWHTNVESIAVELNRALSLVARNSHEPNLANQQSVIHSELSLRFERERDYHVVARGIATSLQPLVTGHATVFGEMQPLRISEIQKQYQKDRQSVLSVRLMPDLEDIARRIAHTAVIHWQVWGDLAYLADDLCIANGVELASEYVMDIGFSENQEDIQPGYDMA